MRATLIVLLLSLISCKSEVRERPSNVIEEEAMTELLYDLQLVEARYQRRLLYEGQTLSKSTLILYHATFEAHGVTEEQFVTSHTYYEEDPEVLAEMYTTVLERLQAAQGDLSKEIKEERETEVEE